MAKGGKDSTGGDSVVYGVGLAHVTRGQHNQYFVFHLETYFRLQKYT